MAGSGDPTGFGGIVGVPAVGTTTFRSLSGHVPPLFDPWSGVGRCGMIQLTAAVVGSAHERSLPRILTRRRKSPVMQACR
jgi:hypothetical protein